MDIVKMALSLLIVLFGLAESRTHYPPPYQTDYVQDNSLSPLGGNANRPVSMREWIKITPLEERIVRVARGQRLELVCEVIGSPAPRVQWYRGTRPVTQMMEEDNMIRGFGLAKIVRKFVVDCAVPAHQGAYTCTAISGAESAATMPTTVIVDGDAQADCRPGAPSIVLWANIVMQTMDSEVKIPCRAHGAPTVQWIHRDGQLINNGPGSRFKVLDNGDLIITKLKWADMGTYTCYAENELGKDTVTTFLYPMLNED